MSDDAYTRDVFDRLSVPPESPQFFAELGERLGARERAATRRWRRTAIIFAVVALASTAAAGALAASPHAAANTVDVTVTCPNIYKGGIPVFSIFAKPTGNPPVDGGHLRPPPPGFRPADGLTVETGDVLYILRLTSLTAGYQLDRQQCSPNRGAKPALSGKGLTHDILLKATDAEEYDRRCTGPGKMIMRLRIVNDSYGAPVRAQLALVRARNGKPLVYIDWSRQKEDTWIDESVCEAP